MILVLDLKMLFSDFPSRRSSRLRPIRTAWHHPGRVVYKCNDQARTTEHLVCMPLFLLFLVKLFFDFELATVIIVGVRSSACNHGQMLRGCMIMQSTTCHSIIRSESLSPINRLRLYRPATSCGSVRILSPLIFALTSGTPGFSECEQLTRR